MPRYFYTDPLKAAWMAKHHGMYLDAEYFDDEKLEYHVEEDTFDFLHLDYSGCDTMQDVIARGGHRKIFINSESLHILEPQENDVGELFGAVNKTIAIFRGIRWWWLYGPEKGNDIRIIQRNGIAFFAPEVEE